MLPADVAFKLTLCPAHTPVADDGVTDVGAAGAALATTAAPGAGAALQQLGYTFFWARI